MSNKSSNNFSKITVVIQKTVFGVVMVAVLSFLVAVIGVGGEWVISNVNTLWAWTASFAVGILIFALWKGLSIRLEKTERLKSEFITIAAHRIRTPMTRIRWMISEIAEDSGLGESNHSIKAMKETVDNLIKAANNLLNAAEVGKSSLYYDYMFEDGNFETLVRQLIAEYSVGAAQKNIKVKVDIPESFQKISFDKERMKTAIGAFIENAIIYTPKD